MCSVNTVWGIQSERGSERERDMQEKGEGQGENLSGKLTRNYIICVSFTELCVIHHKVVCFVKFTKL